MMNPAFSSTKEAVGFALLLVFLLAAPLLSAWKILPQPKPTYSSESIKWERFPWVQKFIFEETNDIDIAFVGSSSMIYGIDTPYVQQKLDERLGRKTVVRTIGWAGHSFDGLYFFTRDLLAHRHVKTLVFYDECSGPAANEVQQFATTWIRYGDDASALADLPVADRAIYYFASVIRMPRYLIEPLAPNLGRYTNGKSISPFWETTIAADPETTLGCVHSLSLYNPDSGESSTNFTPFVPSTSVTPADLRIYTPDTASDFAFSHQPLSCRQISLGQNCTLKPNFGGNTIPASSMLLFVTRNSRPRVATQIQ